VSQPYYRVDDTLSVRALGEAVYDEGVDDEPSVAKQASAFPPNYIHSLDATHMMMTALACHDAGLSFAGVHDSFWTHAADVPACRDIIRQKFVELYEQDLLEALQGDMQAGLQAAGVQAVVAAPPGQGDLDLREVLKSTYFFN
jgi:DNA-directed RNA polymerase, mitochondrial